jgi:hypothetical protein
MATDSVFVMMPCGPSFVRTYQQVVKPAVTRRGLRCSLAEREYAPGPIDEQIIRGIQDARFCIADLTGANPNVLYEVAIAHSSYKPVILLTRGDFSKIPFDVRQHRAFAYKPTAAGHQRLAVTLREAIAATLGAWDLDSELLRKALAPSSIRSGRERFAVVASPLSFRAAFRVGGGWRKRVTTFSDHVGIRGLMQAFGLIYGLERLPELLNPDDFDDEVLDGPETQMNLYTIGSPKANRWTGILMERFFKRRRPRWDFKPDPESQDIWNPRVILRRAGEKYTPGVAGSPDLLRWDFGLVMRGPHPMDPACMLTVMAGRSSLGTEAACLAVTDPACLRKLTHRLESEEEIRLDDHRQAFCAIVSIRTVKLKTDTNSFRVCETMRY